MFSSLNVCNHVDISRISCDQSSLWYALGSCVKSYLIKGTYFYTFQFVNSRLITYHLPKTKCGYKHYLFYFGRLSSFKCACVIRHFSSFWVENNVLCFFRLFVLLNLSIAAILFCFVLSSSLIQTAFYMFLFLFGHEMKTQRDM